MTPEEQLNSDIDREKRFGGLVLNAIEHVDKSSRAMRLASLAVESKLSRPLSFVKDATENLVTQYKASNERLATLKRKLAEAKTSTFPFYDREANKG